MTAGVAAKWRPANRFTPALQHKRASPISTLMRVQHPWLSLCGLICILGILFKMWSKCKGETANAVLDWVFFVPTAADILAADHYAYADFSHSAKRNDLRFLGWTSLWNNACVERNNSFNARLLHKKVSKSRALYVSVSGASTFPSVWRWRPFSGLQKHITKIV